MPRCLPTHLINHSPLNSDVSPAFHSQVQCHTICPEPPPLERSHPQPNPEHPGPSPAADPVPGASARPHWILEYFFPFEHRPHPNICIIVVCTTAGANSRCSHMSGHIQLVQIYLRRFTPDMDENCLWCVNREVNPASRRYPLPSRFHGKQSD